MENTSESTNPNIHFEIPYTRWEDSILPTGKELLITALYNPAPDIISKMSEQRFCTKTCKNHCVII